MKMSKDTMAALNILAYDTPEICLLKKRESVALLTGKSIIDYDHVNDNIVINFVNKLISEGLGENYEKEEHSVNVFDFEGLTIRIESVCTYFKKQHCYYYHYMHIYISKKEYCSFKKWVNEMEKATLCQVLPDIQTNKKFERL